MDPSTPEPPACPHSYPPFTTLARPSTDTTPEATLFRFHPSFLRVLEHLLTPLRPLISMTTCVPHPDFPTTLLAYHLLTSTQLDDLARHYHQVWPPMSDTKSYPQPIPAWVGAPNERAVDVDTKRRRFGRFIGLRGCESPVETGSAPAWESWAEQELMARMEREWQEEELLRARQEGAEGILLRKCGGGS
ncbi:hypothetical protein PHISP_01816 [Aspergillus sp. HF37]|nr:hypothetical protein PHISP_01816 [Aspergillus sp. HF37]